MKEKVVILGGGCGAMAAAFWLTARPDWRDRFESVTLYQVGWRLGGKGASGRGVAQRIEEHGLHLWGGFYQNAFHLMRSCYDELGLDWRTAFSPIDRFSAMEHVDGCWQPWSVTWPRLAGLPGDVSPIDGEPYGAVSAVEIAERALQMLIDELDALDVGLALLLPKQVLIESIRVLIELLENEVISAAMAPVEALLRLESQLSVFMDALNLLGDVGRRLRISTNIITTCVRGMWMDGVFEGGFARIECVELSAWLKHHGATKQALESPMVMGGYDYVFGYEDGDVNRPSLSAGVALRGFGRLLFGYRGSIFWSMQGGMGDVVFAPLYAVLKKRGVQFRFFSRVTGLEPTKHGPPLIETIRFDRQVDLSRAEYEPLLVTSKHGPVWPSLPLFDQIQDGDKLKAGWRDYNLEMPASTWPVANKETLRRDADFDRVVLGISLGELKSICASLAATSTRWQEMFDKVKTVPTLSCQLWSQQDKAAMSWTAGDDPVLTRYVQRFNTVADMSHLVRYEATGDLGAKSIFYFCGPLGGSAVPPGSTQATADELVAAETRHWIDDHVRGIMPGYDPSKVVAFPGEPNAFDGQYFRANFTPSEQYVLSLPGTSAHRLHSTVTGFGNLVLAGDWTANGLDAGCVEAAVTSGTEAARALLGDTRPVPGAADR